MEKAASERRETLQTAIGKAQAEKDVKEQAWILRRAFDAILEECKKADPENDESTKEVVEILKSTIKKGAPLFNDGKHKDCSDLYFQTARATVATFLELELVSQLVDHPTLGVLRLDYDYPAAPGDIDSPDSYDYPVIYRVVPGLTFQMAQSGDLTPEVMEEMKEALRWLTVEAKVTAITGDCGFMMWFQGMARGYTDRPVFLSSLMQLPTISASLCPKHDKILVVTANVPFYLGGTSLLIVVVMVMDFMAQVQSHLMSHQYDSVMKKANLKNIGSSGRVR